MSSLAAAVTRVAHHPADRTVSEAGPAPDGLTDPFLQLMTRAWRAQPEDTVGGWCITLAEDPRSPSDGALAIAMFLSQGLATHIVDIHNRSLRSSDDPTTSAPATVPAPASQDTEAARVPPQTHH